MSGKTSQQGGTEGMQKSSSKPSTRPAEKQTEEARKRRTEDKSKGSDGERTGKPLVRQGSFTIEKPSRNVPIELIPRINRQVGGRERSDSASSMDTATLLKDTEAVMAFLEAKLRDEKKLDPVPPSQPPGCAISPESDIDTTSAVSEAERKSAQKRRSLSSLHKEKSNLSSAGKSAASARDRLERKPKTKVPDSRPDTRRPSQTNSRVRQPSLDLTDDEQTSSLPISDILSSDQETYSGRSHGRGTFTSTDNLMQSKLDSKAAKSSKTSRTAQPSSSTVAKQVCPCLSISL